MKPPYIFGTYATLTRSTSPVFDAVNERLITTLAVKWHSQTSVTVLEAMVIMPEISTTTAHRRLKQLRKGGWIDLVLDENDNRVKYVVPTIATRAYFTALGKLMAQAVSEGVQT